MRWYLEKGQALDEAGSPNLRRRGPGLWFNFVNTESSLEVHRPAAQRFRWKTNAAAYANFHGENDHRTIPWLMDGAFGGVGNENT
jgi:hypothetical protein